MGSGSAFWGRDSHPGFGFSGFRVPDYITIKEWDWELYWGDTGDWEKARKSLGIRISSTPGEFEW